MTMELILWLSMMWMPVLMYFMLANETKFKKNLAVGVTFPQKGREDSQVLDTLARFKRTELAVCVGLMALGAVGMALQAGFVLWLIWIDIVMVAPYVVYAIYNTRLKTLKREKGWAVQSLRTASISAAAIETKWLSPWWFVPAVVLALLPVAFDPFNWVLWVLDAVMAALCFFGYRYLYRNRAETVDDNDALTQALTRVRRRAWGQLWLICAWMMAFVSLWVWLSPMLFPRWPWLDMTAAMALAVVVVAATLRVEFRTRHVQEKLTANSGMGFYVDEDDKWIWGQIYYNPDDSRLIVNNRVGVNTTVNVAKPAGKALLGVVIVLLVAMPLLGVWMENMSKTPVGLEITDTAVVATHGRTRYEVALEDIEEAEVLDALPYMTRTNGTGLDSVLKGRFSTPWGRARVCLDPRTGPWLRLTTAGGDIYLFGDTEGIGVETVYAALAKN